MKKLLLAICFLLFLNISYVKAQNIAYLDLHAVVDKSSEVKQLKMVREQRLQELRNWYDTAITEIDNQKTPKAKQKLLVKYNTQFNKKKAMIYKDYKTKLTRVEQEIHSIIDTQSKAMGYDMVLYKSKVISGGDDITEEIRKFIK